MTLQKIIEKHWYQKNNLILTTLLYPFEFIFCLISKIRFNLYQHNILKRHRLPVPVVVIGNISVGGAGKTPLTKYLAMELINQGINVGIILRGYKSQTKDSYIVKNVDNSKLVGDEALIYAQNGFKVAIGSNRYLAGKKLLEAYPNIQIILSDDGLQHYSLIRDYEIAVIDSTRVFGNQHCIPMGPLREGVNRLNKVNSIVINGEIPCKGFITKLNPKPIIHQIMVLDKIYNPITRISVTNEYFKNKDNIALAAIGNPQRFFSLLDKIGIQTSKNYEFPDHHHYKLEDIPKSVDSILVTEKDSVKLTQFNNDKIWTVFVKSQLDSNYLVEQIKQLVK